MLLEILQIVYGVRTLDKTSNFTVSEGVYS